LELSPPAVAHGGRRELGGKYDNIDWRPSVKNFLSHTYKFVMEVPRKAWELLGLLVFALYGGISRRDADYIV